MTWGLSVSGGCKRFENFLVRGFWRFLIGGSWKIDADTLYILSQWLEFVCLVYSIKQLSLKCISLDIHVYRWSANIAAGLLDGRVSSLCLVLQPESRCCSLAYMENVPPVGLGSDRKCSKPVMIVGLQRVAVN